MPRLTRLCLLALAVTLAGCLDEPPTGITRALAVTPHQTLGNGPLEPQDGGVILSQPVTISNEIAGQFAPRISGSGDLVCYFDYAIDGLQYWRFSTRVSNVVPDSDGGSQCAVDGNRIAFRRFIPEDGGESSRDAIMLFDLGIGFTDELDAQPGSARSEPAIRSNTVAFVENHSTGSDIRTVRLPLEETSLVYSAEEGFLQSVPNVSPNGNLVVWQHCDAAGYCQVLKSALANPTWSAPESVGEEDGGIGPDTDGAYVAYTTLFGTGEDVETDILIQHVTGGPVTQLVIPGRQGIPRVSRGVISFGTFVFNPSDFTFSSWLNVYVIATNRLYEIGATAGAGSHDLAILPNGVVQMVWDVPGAHANVDGDVFATSFFLPGSFPFGGFLAPVNNAPTVNIAKAGAAIPVKFSLGGDRGLSFFASGSPSSVAVACNTGASTDTVEETVAAGSSTLTYDAASDTYSYIWKTDKAWSNTCRRLTLQFIDGTVANADFQFSK